MTKKTVLTISIIGLSLFLLAMYPVIVGICGEDSYYCRKNSDFLQQLLGISPLVLLFSFITYKMSEQVFRAWWNFARWFVPIIILATFLLNMQSSNGGSGISGVASDAFNFLILLILYVIFILTSLIKIFFAHRRTK